ncbi:hypothetical protein M2262_003627 [Pseudomonas sp. BIGb0408]|uniref:Uncharacterized protein n=1 Tax=Phytopseudomonas flavescens TaxID=29435 RepID=A0A7Y9XKW6_9GAMM|nr:hypothetical protein [Pseudomonas sp. BIGb0408]NYH71852.1 hypothetical protein [Pseudomonas flavescens]
MALLAPAVVGCQSVKPDVNTLQQRAQTAIGEPVSQVSNIRSRGQSTYFNDHTTASIVTPQLSLCPRLA